MAKDSYKKHQVISQKESLLVSFVAAQQLLDQQFNADTRQQMGLDMTDLGKQKSTGRVFHNLDEISRPTVHEILELTARYKGYRLWTKR